ncbi:hypothetical protein QTN25_000673 [Entamoeba marina]
MAWNDPQNTYSRMKSDISQKINELNDFHKEIELKFAELELLKNSYINLKNETSNKKKNLDDLQKKIKKDNIDKKKLLDGKIRTVKEKTAQLDKHLSDQNKYIQLLNDMKQSVEEGVENQENVENNPIIPIPIIYTSKGGKQDHGKFQEVQKEGGTPVLELIPTPDEVTTENTSPTPSDYSDSDFDGNNFCDTGNSSIQEVSSGEEEQYAGFPTDDPDSENCNNNLM